MSSLSLEANEGTNVDLDHKQINGNDDDDHTLLITSQATIIQSQSKLTKYQ